MTQPDATGGFTEKSAGTAPVPADRINQPDLDSELESWVQQASGRSDARTLTLDLGAVMQLSSLGLNHLIQLNRLARKEDLEVILTNVQPPVTEVLNLTRLERLFETRTMAPPPTSDAVDEPPAATSTT